MTDDRRGASAPGDGQPKVNDRRRFTRDGEPLAAAADRSGAESALPAEGSPSGEAALPAATSEPAEEAPGSAEGGAPGGERDRRIAEQAARIDELSRAYAALLEDNKGFRARTEREAARVVEAQRATVAQGLLEAADDLERALAAVSGAVDSGGEAFRALVDGVRLSLGALQKRIAEIGAIRVHVVGQPFDPRIAEAVDTVAVASAEQDGMVVQEVRPGYRIGDRVLRPARVRVGRLAQA